MAKLADRERLMRMGIEETPPGDKMLPMYYHHLTRNLACQHKWDEVLEVANEAFELFEQRKLAAPGQVEEMILVDVTVAYMNLGNMQEGLDWAATLVRKFPANIDGWMFLGHAAFHAGEYERAIQAYTSYLDWRTKLEFLSSGDLVIYDTWGDQATAYNNMGAAHNQLGNLDEALINFRIAFKLQPENEQHKRNLDAIMGHIVRASIMPPVEKKEDGT